MRVGYMKKYKTEDPEKNKDLLISHRAEGKIHIESKTKGIDELTEAVRRIKGGGELVVPSLHHLSLDANAQARRIEQLRENKIWVVSVLDNVHTKKMSLGDIYGVSLNLEQRTIKVKRDLERKARRKRRKMKLTPERYAIIQEYKSHKEIAADYNMSVRQVTNVARMAKEMGLIK